MFGVVFTRAIDMRDIVTMYVPKGAEIRAKQYNFFRIRLSCVYEDKNLLYAH